MTKSVKGGAKKRIKCFTRKRVGRTRQGASTYVTCIPAQKKRRAASRRRSRSKRRSKRNRSRR